MSGTSDCVKEPGRRAGARFVMPPILRRRWSVGIRGLLIVPLLLACARHEPVPGSTTDHPAEDAAALETWRIVSYNIRHGRGADNEVDLERTAAVLRRLDPDVVALQEVDQGVARSGGEDQAARLGELLGMHHAFGAFMDYQGGHYGMAILSRCAIRRVDPVRLPDGNEPRVALAVELERPSGDALPLTVVNVHFDWVEDDGYRYAQAQEVARYVDGVAGPLVLLGDFNDQPGSRTLALFRGRVREAAKPADRRLTFPSDTPEREIDYIFVAPADVWEIVEVDVIPEAVASDHRPVVAEFRLSRTERAGIALGRAVAGVREARSEPVPAAGGRCAFDPAAGR